MNKYIVFGIFGIISGLAAALAEMYRLLSRESLNRTIIR